MVLSVKSKIKETLGFFYFNLYKKYLNEIGNRIILYHAIGTKLEFDTYGISISKQNFLEHIIFLKDNYEIIQIDDNYKTNLNRKTVSITFDDGFKDNLYALELLEKYNIPFTLYITTDFIGKKNYLNEQELQLFHKSKLCNLGVHGKSHRHLDKLDYKEQYIELQESKLCLENLLGNSITQMSFPHGCYNESTLKILDILGYNAVSSSHIGLNEIKSLDLKRLKRIEIVASDNLKQLSKKIDGYYDILGVKIWQ